MSTFDETNELGRKASNPAAVSFSGIVKSFFGVEVLKGVTFDVGAGRIMGLVGENGAGKSTLMNLLGGNLQPDRGELHVNGRLFVPLDPEDARAAGIAFVHQELNLFPNLSIAENLFLTSFPIHGRPDHKRGKQAIEFPFIDKRRLSAMARERMAIVGLDHDPATLVESLSAGEKQLVEIAKCVGSSAQVVILDEPTTSLSAPECERLFSLLRKLRNDGFSLIYISHALGDVLRLCDDLVVLRDGEVVGRGQTAEFAHHRLVSLMVGRELNQLYPERRPPANIEWRTLGRETVLLVNALSQPGVVRDISFSLAAGEVLGLAGLMGAGRSELARILFGLDPHSSGTIHFKGEPLEGNPRSRIRRGLAFLTEDRRQEGLCMEASISDNLALVTLAEHSRTPVRWLDLSGIKDAVRRMRDAVRLSPKAPDGQAVRTLSGGNQQKVVLGKWLLAEPSVLILDEPTRGIDVGAKFEIYQLIHQLGDRGAGVLVISSEIEELIGICDRILVMRQGQITGDFPREQFDRERILAAALHASKA
jgi:ribose transport system ATP-binding protein